MKLIDASSRIAISALLHDLGKLAERARIEVNREQLEIWKQLDCPHWDGRPTHIHAAYTTAGFAAIEAHLPTRSLLMADPFGERGETDADDSLINAAARHHRPETFLQWIIATADRLASGFEREEFEKYNRAEEGTTTGRNHYQARLLPLFEHIRLDSKAPDAAVYCQPLKPLSPAAIFPVKRADNEPTDNSSAQAEYRTLWDAFLAALEKLPRSHRDNLPLWLDHLDSAWLAYNHAIPSATAGKTRPDVSLYDHSKAVAALAVALWRWHRETGHEGAEAIVAMKDRSDWKEPKFLLVQGDFSGIQEFIFAEGGQTQRQAAKLLRGRSFHVSLLTELAALSVLEALGLPPTSQIVNAAGKFLIVAPNTVEAQTALAGVRQRLDAWFLEQTFGESGISIVWQAAACADFTQNRFADLMTRLFAALEEAKLQRFNLCGEAAPDPVRSADFGAGTCAFDGRRPADTSADGKPASALAVDQIAIGKLLADPRFDRLLVVRESADLRDSPGVKTLAINCCGYRVAFAKDEDAIGRFGELAASGDLLRCWDFSLPGADASEPLFSGYARRDINAYIPWEMDEVEGYRPVTIDRIAESDEGVTALAVLKGDVDNLGAIFQQGIRPATFAKMAALSRQMNTFFAIYLPWLCRKNFANTYTVFAGGDDFFLIGPWHSGQRLANRLAKDFERYVAGNPELHFSAGIALAKPGVPIRALAANADEALDQAKQGDKNAVTCHGVRVDWAQFAELTVLEDWFAQRRKQLSTGFVYRLLRLAEMAASGKPEDAIWQSWLAYRVRRFVVDKLPEKERNAAQAEIAGRLRHELQTGKLAVRIPVANYLYRYRD